MMFGHSSALFNPFFGHDGTPSLPHHVSKISRRLTALTLTYIIKQALSRSNVAGDCAINLQNYKILFS